MFFIQNPIPGQREAHREFLCTGLLCFVFQAWSERPSLHHDQSESLEPSTSPRVVFFLPSVQI